MIAGLQDFQLQHVITAIGGLGTAAFGLVDAAKSAISGINRIGFRHIKQVVSDLTPEGGAAGIPVNALPRVNILETLEANWANGADLSTQKETAKSLIKMHLSVGNAAEVAAKTNTDPAQLSAIAASIASGTPLTPPLSDVYDLHNRIVVALLDEAYQISDQAYRNATRTLASLMAIGLALVGAWSLEGTDKLLWHRDLVVAVVVGLLATPLAPIAKDLATGLATAVNTMQIVKK